MLEPPKNEDCPNATIEKNSDKNPVVQKPKSLLDIVKLWVLTITHFGLVLLFLFGLTISKITFGNFLLFTVAALAFFIFGLRTLNEIANAKDWFFFKTRVARVQAIGERILKFSQRMGEIFLSLIGRIIGFVLLVGGIGILIYFVFQGFGWLNTIPSWAAVIIILLIIIIFNLNRG